ncbi:hypothetical protein EGS38_06325 [Neisseria chenwenguii]|nr:hypothetical protein EGS38_06325 [Neisseria chenwenguii]
MGFRFSDGLIIERVGAGKKMRPPECFDFAQHKYFGSARHKCFNFAWYERFGRFINKRLFKFKQPSPAEEGTNLRNFKLFRRHSNV